MVGVRVAGCLTILAALGAIVAGDGRSNSRDICLRDPPHTAASPTPGDNGFRIKFAGKQLIDKYTPGQVYTVTINGSYPEQTLEGFMMVAVPVNARDESTQMGTFQHFSSGMTKSAEACPWVITHTHLHPKAGVQVLWTAPNEGAGCVEFRVTVVEKADIWYRDDGALTKVLCEETGKTDSQAQEMIPDCCACGTGKYQMTFHGLWSRQTHPKDWPRTRRMLHWSNLVGASHSKHYMIWQYGAYASKGVKEVCEYGYPRSLEQEMRQHSRDVRTVIKTPGIWWSDPDGLRQTRWARFSVDRRNHLLTMLTMLGPSPDWCVGVTSLNLCLPNCTWAGDMTIDLYPWDAGTDDGVTYMSRNMKTEPQQKIHHITNEYPDNPASPFNGPDPMHPLARLTLRRIHPKPGASSSCFGNETDIEEDENDYTFDLDLEGGNEGDVVMIKKDSDRQGQGQGQPLTDMEKKKQMMMQNSGKCKTSDWMDWSECSVTCSVGQRVRKRTFLNPMMDEVMCGLPLMESENCIGIENECETVDDECAVTAWSDWSPCSVTCGKGIKERRRYYLRSMDMKKCSRQTEEREVCMSDILDCDKALSMKNFTAICALPKDPGPCRGRFSRFYYDSKMHKCLEFTYRGCRGNNNRFRSLEECQEMCEDHMKTVIALEESKRVTHHLNVMTDKEAREQKAKSKKHPKKSKSKKKDRHHSHRKDRNKKSDKVTPVNLELKDRDFSAGGPSIDCFMSEWTPWSTCSATCGQSYHYKTRMVKQEAVNGGKKCPSKLEKKKRCKIPRCQYPYKLGQAYKAEVALDCTVTPWSPWSLCSATCGKSYKYARRTVVHPPQNEGDPCPRKLERKVRCSVPRCPTDCELTSWSSWTSCAKSCGEDSIQERARQVVNNPKRGGTQCGPRLQRRYCMLPTCPEPPKRLSKRERMKMFGEA